MHGVPHVCRPKTVWFIETRFRDNELSLETMAEHAGVSRSHLSRIFPVATGLQLSSYLRGRRLTEAARELADGAPDILDVALDAGYGSHEAFTRAFRDQFGLTPDEVRRRRSLDTLDLVEPLRMDTAEKVTLAPPVIEDRPAQRIAGLSQPLHLQDAWIRSRTSGSGSAPICRRCAYGGPPRPSASADRCRRAATASTISPARRCPRARSAARARSR